MSGHTPGPWWISGKGTIRYGDRFAGTVEAGGWIGQVHWRNRSANARLIALAPDHALVGWALCVAGGRWEPLGDRSGEFCMNGIRHCTKLDEFGVPALTANLRAKIIAAKGGAA